MIYLFLNTLICLKEEVIRCRSGKKIEQRYLRRGFNHKITVLRILDSRTEKFVLSKAYTHKIAVIDIITAPEIEMLIILNEDKYKEFIKSKKKPSDFCTTNLRLNDVKSYDFVKKYFYESSKLVASIQKYKKIKKVPKGEHTLSDLLRSTVT